MATDERGMPVRPFWSLTLLEAHLATSLSMAVVMMRHESMRMLREFYSTDPGAFDPYGIGINPTDTETGRGRDGG